MAMFNSYVKLPKGKYLITVFNPYIVFLKLSLTLMDSQLWNTSSSVEAAGLVRKGGVVAAAQVPFPVVLENRHVIDPSPRAQSRIFTDGEQHQLWWLELVIYV